MGTNTAKIKLTFFKASGKYYAEETVEIPDAEMPVFKIVDWLRENVKGYKGMYLFAMLDELGHGYPVMVPAAERA